MSESRCFSNLEVLSSDKSEFKSWNEKLINAAAQSLGTPWRKYMRNLNKAFDKDRKVLDDNQLIQIAGADEIVDGDSRGRHVLRTGGKDGRRCGPSCQLR